MSMYRSLGYDKYMATSAQIIRLSEWIAARSRAASGSLLGVSELRHSTLPVLSKLLEACARESHHCSRAQIEDILLELKQRHERLTCTLNEIDALAGDDDWQNLSSREPLVEFIETTANRIAILINEAQMIGAWTRTRAHPKLNSP